MNSLLANLPIIRAYRHDSVPYHTGSILGNRLGLQVFRTASQNLQYRLRGWSGSGSNDNCVKEVAKNGIAVIENFLDPEEFARVRTEFEEAFKNVQPKPYKGGTNARLYRMQVPLPDAPHTFSKIRENFQRNQRLNSIASAVVRRKISGPPKVHLDWYQSNDLTAVDTDIENILHADLHTATVKLFYFIEDVSELNGAFIYAKGSHRLTLSRLRHEYELSLRQAKLRNGRTVDPSLLESRSDEVRNIIHPKFRQMIGVEETQLCVEANTLVIANNMGFHRRGEFLSNRPRKSIQINYRYLEKPLGASLFSRNGQ